VTYAHPTVSHDRFIALDRPVDLDATLGVLVHQHRDACSRPDAQGTWHRALRTPAGPATLSFTPEAGGVRARAHGPGAEWALESAPGLAGALDSLDGFEPTGVVAELHRKAPGFRMARARPVFESALLPVLEQKVTGKEAWLSRMRLVRALGEPAPGPFPLLLPPAPEAVVALPSHELRRMGIDARRGGTLQNLARRAAALERLVERGAAAFRTGVESLPGVGPWTSARIRRAVLGDPDALPLGDHNLPSLVAFNLTGEPAADDARMLELLAPYAGHRGRVALLCQLVGRSVPRRGPRRRLPRHAGFR
jgi:3-methyladenine DNA glycosylase/8-oxoguanine DNA glycosylase